MEIVLEHQPGASSATLQLGPNETATAEGGAMISMSGDMNIKTTTHKKGKGGVLKAMKRLLAGESFFLNHFTAGSSGGEVIVAASLAGDMLEVQLNDETLIVQAGSFVAMEEQGVQMDVGWQGFKTLFARESMFWLKMSGRGKLVVASFGAIYPIDIDGEHIIDTGHIVAFQETLDFSISKAGKSWFSSFLGGEGLVCRFKGVGRVWVQSHNASAFGKLLGPKLKSRAS
jgi:uncharacterized protein (TIGR00266 family)